jgi:RND family efflux transporter MFP subunit
MKTRPQLLIALLLIAAGGLSAFAIVRTPPQTDRQEETAKPPSVKAVEVKFESLRMDVRSQGRVTAHTEIDLVAEVSGHVIHVSPAFVNGGFFRKGDMLVAVDPADYALKVTQAHARVMEARYLLAREEAEAEQAINEWQHLGQGEPSALTQRIPQLEERRAKLAAEQAELANAKLLRQRTEIRAPFDGRVRSREIGVGQYLVSGAVLGRIYSSDVAEVQLPVSTSELALVDLPGPSTSSSPAKAPKVVLTADYQGQSQSWEGQIVRSEGVVDRDTGMITLVAKVSDPFNLASNKSLSPALESPNPADLPVGLFVHATIDGRWLDDLVILPSVALLKNNQVVVIDQDNRLRFRSVEILRSEREQVIISGGLKAGERVLTMGLHNPVEGMQVASTLLGSSSSNVASVQKGKDDASIVPVR